jgi:hypothetical protein
VLPLAVATLGLAQIGIGVGAAVMVINDQSLRQSVTPDALQGRVNATCHLLLVSTFPIGALIGGILAEGVGLRSTLLIGGVGGLLSAGWLIFSPVRLLRNPPTVAPEPLQVA